MKKSIILLTAMLIFALASGIGAAKEIPVNPTDSIQAAVNNATSGDVIVVKPGAYIENIIISKPDIVIRSESGNFEDTIITAKNPSLNVISLEQASNITISGFKIESGGAGVYLFSCNGCRVMNNNLSDNRIGIHLSRSNYNTIVENQVSSNTADGIHLVSSERNSLLSNTVRSNNHGIVLENAIENNLTGNTVNSNINHGFYLMTSTGNILNRNTAHDNFRGINHISSNKSTISGNDVSNNREHGMWISRSNYNIISGNTANETSRGIYLDSSTGNNVSGNIVAFNSVSGFYECRACRRNLFFNNYANNSRNTDINTGDTTWNIEKTPGTNIVGGPYLGGNFWAKPGGNGFSQTATDGDKDGIADAVYTGDLQNVTDYLPLVSVSNPEKPVLPVADFSTNVTGGYAPLSVQFTNLSQNTVFWRWDFESDGNIDSTDQNPVHTYTIQGNYTVNLIAGNANGTGSKIKNIVVQEAQNEEKIVPVANFSASPLSGYAPLSVKFTDLSKNTTSRNWDFGDGNRSTEQNPMHTYSAPGTYTVNLTVSNANDSSSKLSTINVLQPSVYAYITNIGSNNVSVIDISTNTIKATMNVGHYPLGVVVVPDGTKAYVANAEGTVSIIDTYTNNVIGTVEVGGYPYGIAVTPDGTKVYVANSRGSKTVSVIDTSTNTVTAAVPVGDTPLGVAVTPDGTKVYVTNYFSDNISIIDTAINNVIGTVNIGDFPVGVAVSPDGKKVYVANTNYLFLGSGIHSTCTVSVIDTTTNNVTAVVEVGASPSGIAVNPTGTKVYVANYVSNNVSVIDTATNNVTASVNVGICPCGVAVSPDGRKVYVTNQGSNNVSIIDTATNNVIDTVNVGNSPVAFGQFIGEKSVAPVSNVSSNTAQVMPELTEADNGRRVNFKYGEIFYLILPENPGTSYALQLELSNGLTILSEKSVLINPPAYFEVPGGVMGVFHIWKIKANSEGSKQIKGTYIQPISKEVARTYTVYLKIGDGGSSGGRGGGGGGGSPEPAKNVQVKELSQTHVASGKPVKFDFAKNATCVVYVSFDAKKTAGKITTIAEQLKAKSTLTSNLSSGEVYKYFNLWVGNAGFADPKNIGNPVICFKVEKSWLQEKKIDRNSIILNRYSDKKWSELPVKLLREDDKYFYFTADTPGFTFFAITGKPVEKEAGIEIKPETSTSKLDKNITASEIEQEQKPEQGNLTGSHESEEGSLTSIPEFKTLYAIVCLFIAYVSKKR